MRLSQITDPINLALGRDKFKCLDLIPTWKCNARCITCDSWKLGDKMLSYHQTMNVLEYFKDLDLLIIEGGEVALWPELPWMVEWFIRNRKGEILILTNGFNYMYWARTVDEWDRVLGKGYQRVRFVVSLNGIKGHDISRGVEGAFGRSAHTVYLLRARGNKVTIQFVPFKFNEDEYFQVKEFANENGCQMIIDWPSFATKFESARRLEPADPEKIDAMYQDNLKGASWLRRWSREYFLDNVKKKIQMPCIAGRQFAHVAPSGAIKLCAMSTMCMGVVTDSKVIMNETFNEIWQNKIPYDCQYDKQGNVCCDYMPIASIEKHPLKLLNWKVRSKCGGLLKGLRS